jgi:hypothetical protein
MNKLYFASNSINLYSEDLQYLQDSIGAETKKILLAVTGGVQSPVISTGFIAEVSPTDNTKIYVHHNGGNGTILTADGVITTTTEEYDRISIANPVIGIENFIYARYYVQDATYNIKNDTIIYEKKAIDLNTYQYVYNRQIDLVEIVVYTSAQYDALSDIEKGHCIFLGMVIGRGAGVPLIGVDGTYRKYLAAAIPDNSIELIKLVSNFMLPQTMVEDTATSSFINDNYRGTPSDLVGDLNKIRTIIRDIKATDTWDQPTTGIKASEPDINHLHRSGLFEWENNLQILAGDSLIPTSTGCIVVTSTGEQGEYFNEALPWISHGQGVVAVTGKVLYKNLLRELTSSTGLLLTDPNIYQVGIDGHSSDPFADSDYEIISTIAGVIPQGTVFQLAHFPVRNVVIKTTFIYGATVIYATLNQGEPGDDTKDYSIDNETGRFTIEISGGINPSTDEFRVFYQWGEQRIDTIVLSTSSGLTVIDGTPVTSTEIPQPPIIPNNVYAIANLHFGILQDRLYQKDITYHHIHVEPIREVRDIKATDINHYDIYGDFNPLFIEGVQRLNILSSTGNIPLSQNNGYIVTSTGNYSNIEIDADAYIQTNIFTQTNDELYISVIQQDADYLLTIDIETVPASNVFDEQVILTVPRKKLIEDIPVMLLIYKGFTEGYHKIKINSIISYKLHKIIIGKLDTYYLKNNSYVENIATDNIYTHRIHADSIRMNWETGYYYLVDDIVEHSNDLYKCKTNHISSTFLSDYNISNHWTKFGNVDSITNQLNNMKEEMDKVESINLEQQLRLNILEGRQYSTSDIQIDTYTSEEMSFDYETNSNITAEIMDDNDWNNNWKEIPGDSSPSFKQGFLRPRKQPYMLEIIDEYNIDGIGQSRKCAMSRYDSVNKCYWLISNNGANTIGQISKLSENMKDGKVEETAKWYLPPMGSTTCWTGMDVTPAGTHIFIVLNDSSTNTATPSAIFKIKINSDGTIGRSNVKSGEILLMSVYNGSGFIGNWSTVSGLSATKTATITGGTITNTSYLRVGMGIWLNATDTHIISIDNSTQFTVNINSTGSSIGYFDFETYYMCNTLNQCLTDITYWSNDGTSELLAFTKTTSALTTNRAFELNFIRATNAASGWPLTFDTTAIPTPIPSPININTFTFPIYESYDYSLCRDGNYLWLYINNANQDIRFIHRINITTDIVSNYIKGSSGRFETTRRVDNDVRATGSISIGSKGDLLEIVSTPSNGKFIARRALKNTLWSENQISSEYKMNASTNPITPVAMMVDPSGNYWTGHTAVTAQTVYLYRFNPTTAAIHAVRLASPERSWTSILDLTTDGTNVWMLGTDGANYEILKGSLSALEGSLGSYGVAVINIHTWGTIFGNGATFTNILTGICYNSSTNLLYVLNTTTNKIDTLATTTSASLTSGVYALPAPGTMWRGIACKNNNLYVGVQNNSQAFLAKIYTIPLSHANSTSMYRSHIYQGPDSLITNYTMLCFDFIGNDLITIKPSSPSMNVFVTMKTLEDPDVMQLHSFIDNTNVLLSAWVSCTTPITERYFKPEQFSDTRNIPDQFHCAVGYGNEGFSVLHLDNFLSGKSSTGKDRYNVSDIRVWHFKRGTTTGAPSTSGTNIAGSSATALSNIYIEKELIVATGNIAATNAIECIYLDIKSGKSIYIGASAGWSGVYYNGTFSQRSDGLTYIGAANPELYTSHAAQYKLHARTFTKEDESDYAGVNPVTFVAIGTAGGCDLLRIDWDSNGNRTPVKVWNNVFNYTSIGRYSNFIAPSGRIFGGYDQTAGELYTVTSTVSNVMNQTLYVWEINADGGSGITYLAIGTNILDGNVMDISPNSRCWKTPAGTWRHLLICGTYAGNTSNVTIVDVENPTYQLCDRVYYNTSYTLGSVDNFEDKVIATNMATSNYFNFVMIANKRRFNDKNPMDSVSVTPNALYNNWSANILWVNTRPMMALGATYINGSGGGQAYPALVKYSKDFNTLFVSNPNTTAGAFWSGLQMMWFPNQNNAIYESKDFTIDNPNKIIFKNTLLLSYTDL